ncbi:DUF1800 family protein [bacterium]|nr:DUF1800 family protein [bacterium]
MKPSTFGPAEAFHLLKRVQFGVHPAEVDLAVREGLDNTLERLLSQQPESAEFQSTDQALRTTALATGNIQDLKIWWLVRMLTSANPLREKLALGWHNHFATSHAKVQSVPFMLAQNELFRTHAWGEFPALLHAVARDPAMLIWLDGNANRKRHPNENFAREVMELFTLGIGHYSEHDIQEAARAFSGWHLRDKAFWFNATQHDATPKTIFGHTGNYIGSEVLDLCLAQPACAQFLAGRLLRTFVTDRPTQSQLATTSQLITQHRYHIAPVLRTIFRDEEFFAAPQRQAMIKSPLDYVLGLLRPLGEQIHWRRVTTVLANLGQDLFEPPSVKGWEGGRHWIQSTSLILRWNFATEFLTSQQIAKVNTEAFSSLSEVADAELWCLGGTPEPQVHAALQQEWQNTTSADSSHATIQRLQFLVALPEYQLM